MEEFVRLCGLRVVIRGAGDLATGVALRLWRAGFARLVLLEREHPLAVRRQVCFSEAARLGNTRVEGVEAQLAADPSQARELLARGMIPVLADPAMRHLPVLNPHVLIDATLAKRNLGTAITDAPLVIALGPGFSAGVDAHRVVETHRGHGLGRVIIQGPATPNTGVPGEVMGYTSQRVLRAPCDGVFRTDLDIGQHVQAGQRIGRVEGADAPAASGGGGDVIAAIGGVLRGILPDATPVTRGLKLGDVDPRGNVAACSLVSDKALAIGGGVLEAILHHYNTGPLGGSEEAHPWP